MSKNNSILQIQFCYIKLKSLENDVRTWNLDGYREADKAEIKALLDRIRSLRNELDNISTLQLAKLTKKEVKDYDSRCLDLIRQWKELRGIFYTTSENAYSKYFKVLKMKPTNDFGEIKKAYKKRAQETHPDHSGNDEEFLKVKEAYDKLKAVYEK